jgi:hypothetical protein
MSGGDGQSTVCVHWIITLRRKIRLPEAVGVIRRMARVDFEEAEEEIYRMSV